jgi:rubrerythrin
MVTFEDVINFAIEREREAVDFYRELRDLVTNEALKKELAEFEAIEEEHVRLLESVLDNKGFPRLDSAPADLRLSEYLVQVAPMPDMSFQDILITAIKKEENAAKLYTIMREKAPNAEVRQTFDRLADEELKHKVSFETKYEDEVYQDP